MRALRSGRSLFRPLWTRLPGWFAVELDDPAEGPVQVGPSWVLEAEAIKELLQGATSELPPATHRPYEVADNGPGEWRYLVVHRSRIGSWLVARTTSRHLAERIADHLNRSLGGLDPDERDPDAG